MRPITITQNLIDTILEDFRIQLEGHKAVTDRINYSKTLSEVYKKDPEIKSEKVHVCFTTDAYMKMYNLVNTCADEIGWHGTVNRISEKEFLIDEILVFPQIVSGTEVTPNEEAFAKWMLPFFEDDDDDTIQRMRFHGHSHVNMGVTPSGTDDNYQSNMLTKIKDYYIFMIVNKRGDQNIMIYDMKNNVYYDKDDVVYDLILSDGTKISVWTEEQMKQVHKRSYASTNTAINTPAGITGKGQTEATKETKPEKETRIVKATPKEKIYFDEQLHLYVVINAEGRKLYSHTDPRATAEKQINLFELEGRRIKA